MPQPIKELTPNQIDGMHPTAKDRRPWIHGLPSGIPTMRQEKEYEFHRTPGGDVWHRKKLDH